MSSPAVKLPQQQTPTPKSKMRKLQWNKIPATKVIGGGDNLWKNVGKMFTDVKVNFDQMEELFAVKTKPKVSSEQPEDSSSATTPMTEKKKKSEVV